MINDYLEIRNSILKNNTRGCSKEDIKCSDLKPPRARPGLKFSEKGAIILFRKFMAYHHYRYLHHLIGYQLLPYLSTIIIGIEIPSPNCTMSITMVTNS